MNWKPKLIAKEILKVESLDKNNYFFDFVIALIIALIMITPFIWLYEKLFK